MKCPICSKEKTTISALIQHARRAHASSNSTVYELIYNIDTNCSCGGKKLFISIELGFEDACKGCILSSGRRTKRGELISAALMGHKQSDVAKEKISKSRKGKPTTTGMSSWSKGLTKNDHPSLLSGGIKTSAALRARYSNPETPHWIAGLTKDTDARVNKIAKSLKENFANGKKQWCDGLTKETDSRIALISEKKRLSHEVVNKRCKEWGFTLNSVYELQGYILHVTCDVCNNDSLRSFISLRHTSGRCKHCDPIGCSAWQLEVLNYTKRLVSDVISNDRNVIAPLELDILIPSKKFAIECNGLYWHSINAAGNEWSHEFKSRLSSKSEIRLLHLFEDEWRDKKEIVESMIAVRLENFTKLFARKLIVKEVSSKDAKNFFEENHLDGHANASVTMGLYLESVLVSAMSLRRSFHKKWSNRVEVARFATAKNYVVVGGLSRLTSHLMKHDFLKDKIGLITYVDTRLGGGGKSYESAGWTLSGETKPRFWWTDNRNRFDRFAYRASNGKSEKQVALENKVSRIYGCKNLIFVYNR